jgi:glutaconate CoA-transferase, subunit A
MNAPDSFSFAHSGPANLVSLRELVAEIQDGATLAVPKDGSGVAMAATRALIRQGVKNLHLITVPTAGLQAELLIGSGALATIETSAVTMGEFGPAPRFVAAVKAGSVKLLDATCPAVYAALQAGQKGIPFIPLRGLLETDLLAKRSDWKVIDNPFNPGEPIVLLKAIRPDIALFHAPLADRYGNVFISREREVLIMAQAAHRTLVTVEAITDDDLIEDQSRAGATLPAIYVDKIALAPKGSWPIELQDYYGRDDSELARYMGMAKTQEGFETYLAQWLQGDLLQVANHA